MTNQRCKMCGGTLIIQEDGVTGICDHCGNKWTISGIDDDRLANLLNRANNYRRHSEYDKASSVYETILAEDDSIAEAHWGVVLCRYGIEYVEDPATHKSVPTCNRTRIESIFEDPDYRAAMKYAEHPAAEFYANEAGVINTIQKGILATARTEKPYDIFISYKDTSNGDRTVDSVLAQGLYDRLTKEGYRVFFSRISLEGKLGHQYEPIIFAALNSAKAMLVVGTCRENFESPWVKNEWSRYIVIQKENPDRLLIPCYKDMDVYDLPDELGIYQCQDMTKIGFEQDLIHAIEKNIKGNLRQWSDAGNAPYSGLLRRGYMFLEDKEWEKATEYFNRVLDLEPECGGAYAGFLCVSQKVTSIDILGKTYVGRHKNQFQPYSRNLPGTLERDGNYQKAIKFADAALLKKLSLQEKIVKDAFTALLKEKKQKETEIEEEKRRKELARQEEEKRKEIELLKNQQGEKERIIRSAQNRIKKLQALASSKKKELKTAQNNYDDNYDASVVGEERARAEVISTILVITLLGLVVLYFYLAYQYCFGSKFFVGGVLGHNGIAGFLWLTGLILVAGVIIFFAIGACIPSRLDDVTKLEDGIKTLENEIGEFNREIGKLEALVNKTTNELDTIRRKVQEKQS